MPPSNGQTIQLEQHSDDSDDGYDIDREIPLRDIKKSMTINVSISAEYTKWRPREAFREMVQNWRDGIIKSFNLAEKDFCVLREERISANKIDIVYKVPDNTAGDRKEWLGYIRFQGSDGKGTIDITNRSATLEPRHLDLGGTSKAGDVHQAGAHGEGLKLALIVLMRGRQNHNVNCRTGGCNWTFNFTTRRRLVARIHRMSPKRIQETEDLAQRVCQKILVPFAAKTERDVQFVIGETYQRRDEFGRSVKRSPVKLDDFLSWTKGALFLQDLDDDSIVSTEYGDLLIDSKLRGCIYLKGLLLRESTPEDSASITKLPLKFGYNFAFGSTNRERQSVATASEEARSILAIWRSVLVAKPEMVQELSDMLNDDDTDYADICKAKWLIDLQTATRLRNDLFGKNGKWYYSREEKSSNPRLDHIIEGLGCEGVELTKVYWNILHQHNLVRSAEEEEQRRFKTALPATIPETTFASAVHRLLRACLRTCSQTEEISITFVKAGRLHLQLALSEAEQQFLAHERWLSSDGATTELGLPDNLTEDDRIFHAVKRLFAEALETLPRDSFLRDDDGRAAEWRRRMEISLAEQRLLTYFRWANLTVVNFETRAGFHVKWESTKDIQGNNRLVEIQCHRASSCSHLRDTLLVTHDAFLGRMACTVDNDESESLAQDPTNEALRSQPPTCQVSRGISGETHDVFDLMEGQDYFFVLAPQEDLTAIVVISGIQTTRRPISIPQRSGTPRASAQFENQRNSPVSIISVSEDTDGSELDDNKAQSSSPEIASQAEPDLATTESRLPSPGVRSAVQTASAAGVSIQTAEPSLVGSFTLIQRLQSLNILNIDTDRWYEAKGPSDVRGVVGILKGERVLPEESRKRRRVDSDI